MEKKPYEFLISGVPYKLKTSHEEALVQELVDLVNHKMSQSLAATKNGSYQNAAVLTALHLAEELVLLKRRAHRELERLEENVMVLSPKIIVIDIGGLDLFFGKCILVHFVGKIV